MRSKKRELFELLKESDFRKIGIQYFVFKEKIYIYINIQIRKQNMCITRKFFFINNGYIVINNVCQSIRSLCREPKITVYLPMFNIVIKGVTLG